MYMLALVNLALAGVLAFWVPSHLMILEAAKVWYFQDLEDEYGIHIHVLPRFTERKGYRSAAEPIALHDFPRAKKLLAQALAQYPPGVVPRYLGHVFLLKQLVTRENHPIGGMSSLNCVYVASEWTAVPDEYLLRMIHHEIAHAFYRTTGIFRTPEWKQCNPKGFVYDQNPYQPRDRTVSPDLLRQGFLRPYAQASPAEDFAVFSEQAFGHPLELMRNVRSYPRLRAKFRLWLDAYHRIDPRFSEAFFLSSSPKATSMTPLKWIERRWRDGFPYKSIRTLTESIGDTISLRDGEPWVLSLCDRILAVHPDSQDVLLTRAGIFQFKGEWQKALADLNRLVEVAPYRSEAYLARGYVWARKHEYGRAMADLNRCLKLEPASAKSYSYRAWVLMEQDDMTQALKDFTRAIELDPKNAQMYIGRGKAFAVNGQIVPALEDYTRALELQPHCVDALINRGYLRAKLQSDYSAGFSDLNQALAIKPGGAEAYLIRGWMYYFSGCYAEALRDFKRSEKIDPEMAGIYLGRGYALLSQGRWEQGRLSFAQTLKKDPYLRDARRQCGAAYAADGRYSPAYREYVQILKAEPVSAEDFFTRGLALQALGRYAPASEDLRRAWRTYPNAPGFLAGLGGLLAAQGRPEQALDYFTQALRTNPRNPEVRGQRGYAYFLLGQYDQALLECDLALAKNPSQVNARLTVGYIHAIRGRPLWALADYSAALAINPRLAEAYIGRGLACEALGRTSRARADFQRALKLKKEFAQGYAEARKDFREKKPAWPGGLRVTEEQLFDNNPEFSEPLFFQGLADELSGRKTASETCFRSYLQRVEIWNIYREFAEKRLRER